MTSQIFHGVESEWKDNVDTGAWADCSAVRTTIPHRAGTRVRHSPEVQNSGVILNNILMQCLKIKMSLSNHGEQNTRI